MYSEPLSIGLNCALGPKELEPYLMELNRISETYVAFTQMPVLPKCILEDMMKHRNQWQNLLKNGVE